MCVLNVKAVVAAFNQEKALVGAFSVITNLRMDLFVTLVVTLLFSRLDSIQAGGGAAAVGPGQNILSEMSQH